MNMKQTIRNKFEYKDRKTNRQTTGPSQRHIQIVYLVHRTLVMKHRSHTIKSMFYSLDRLHIILCAKFYKEDQQEKTYNKFYIYI